MGSCESVLYARGGERGGVDGICDMGAVMCPFMRAVCLLVHGKNREETVAEFPGEICKRKERSQRPSPSLLLIECHNARKISTI